MGIFDYFTRRTSTDKVEVAHLEQELKDLRLKIGQMTKSSASIQATVKERRRTLSKPLMYRTRSDKGSIFGRATNQEYIGPAYDLGEIARAIDVEPYINQSVRKHREQILKEGFHFSGIDESMVRYLNQRIFEMELVSNVSFEQVIREFTTNLIAYGTAFIVLKRDDERSSGAPIRLYGKTLQPIAAIYPMDSTSVTVKLNKHGHPVKWRQTIENSTDPEKDTIEFDASDVILATMDKKAGFVFGTPYILPVLDDVRSLRRLEETAEVIAQKYAYPIYHFKVGEKDNPAMILDDGTSEIDIVRGEVENLPAEGGIVTSHRVESDTLGDKTALLNVEPYMKYFEERVMGGLRLSDVDLGRVSASKASATTVSQGLQDSARDFQAVLSDVLSKQLLLGLLLEGGFDVTIDNVVKFKFEMINREEERSQQTHGQDLYLGGTLTVNEYRKEYLNKEALTPEEELQTSPGMKHEQAKELAKMAAAQAAATSAASQGSTAIKNKTANKNRPANQNGQKSTKTRITANNNFEKERETFKNIQLAALLNCKESVFDFFNKHGIGGVSSSDDKFDCTTKEEELAAIFSAFVAFATTSSRDYLTSVIECGVEDCMNSMDIIGPYTISKKLLDRFFKNYIEKGYKKLSKLAIDSIDTNKTLAGISAELSPAVAIASIFDQLSEDLKFTTNRQIDISYRYGYVRSAKSHGYKTVYFTSIDGEEEDKEISLTNRDIPYSILLNTNSQSEFCVELGEK
jgi:hypothetical protein